MYPPGPWTGAATTATDGVRRGAARRGRGRAALLAALLLCGPGGAARADEPAVPVELQAELLARVVKYDRNFTVRSGERLQVLVAWRPGAEDSERIARQMAVALGNVPAIGGLPHDEHLVAYSTPARLRESARSTGSTLVILAPGIETDASALAKVFEGFDGLTVTTTAYGVDGGIVLGFDLVSGKPRMLLHLTQARKQHADFKAEVLKVMKVSQ